MWVTGIVAAFGATATVARAAEPAPAAPASELSALIEQQTADGWQLVITDPDSPAKFAYFGRATDIGRLGPYLMAWFRQERTEPKSYPTDGGAPFLALSSIQGWVFDCKGARSDVTDIVAYAEHGGKGDSSPSRREVSELTLTVDAPNSVPATLRSWACEHYTPPSTTRPHIETAPAAPAAPAAPKP